MALPTTLASIDIQRIIFEQILKVQPTGNFQADFLNLIFFPHLVIVIWLFFIAKSGIFIKLHKGLGFLLSTGIYVFIVYNGWYAAIASLSIFWLTLTIFISLFYFIFPIIVHPSVTKQRYEIGKSIKKSVLGRHDREKAIEALDEDIKEFRRERKYFEDITRDPTKSSDEKKAAVETLREIDFKILEYEHEKRRLEKTW